MEIASLSDGSIIEYAEQENSAQKGSLFLCQLALLIRL